MTILSRNNDLNSCDALLAFVSCLQSNNTESLKRLLLNSKQLEVLKSSIVSYGNLDPMPLLHVSVLNSSLEFIDVMLRFGFDPNAKAPKGKQETCLSLLVRTFESASDKTSEQSNLMLEIISLLLSNGANPTIPDLLLWKPIHSTQEKKIIKMLLRSGESIDSIGGMMQQTPLILASRKGNKELVAWYLKNHANPNVCDKLGFYPIHHALGSEHVVRLLLTVGKQDINKRASNSEGQTPLHFCCERETKGIQGKSNLLILFNSDPNIKTLTSNKTAEDVTDLHKYLFKLYRSSKKLSYQQATNICNDITDIKTEDEEESDEVNIIIREQFNKYMINYNYLDNLTKEEKRLSISHLILDNYMD